MMALPSDTRIPRRNLLMKVSPAAPVGDDGYISIVRAVQRATGKVES